MSVSEVRVSAQGGTVVLRVAEDAGHPHSIAAVVTRFDAAGAPDGEAGEITRDAPELALGSPASIAGKGFAIDGFVLPFMDNPPAPYTVTVAVLQRGDPVHREVPEDHGKGTIGTQAVRFGYSFVVRSS
jgi:hypothetical protein